jgi:hypothetical protein
LKFIAFDSQQPAAWYISFLRKNNFIWQNCQKERNFRFKNFGGKSENSFLFEEDTKELGFKYKFFQYIFQARSSMVFGCNQEP